MSREFEVKQALHSIGAHGKVKIVYADVTARVYVDGKYFGTYNFQRHTFTD